VPELLMLAGGAGFAAATAALWLQERRRGDHRWFAGLIAVAVTLSLFSVITWAATLIARIAPLALTWVFVATLALLFAQRLYRELRAPPSGETHRPQLWR
jgi:cobalamin biosynthesis protein CobD/CbiB